MQWQQSFRWAALAAILVGQSAWQLSLQANEPGKPGTQGKQAAVGEGCVFSHCGEGSRRV